MRNDIKCWNLQELKWFQEDILSIEQIEELEYIQILPFHFGDKLILTIEQANLIPFSP